MIFPSLAYAGIPYQVVEVSSGALALTTPCIRLARTRSDSCISAIFARNSLSPSALPALGARRSPAWASRARSLIAARSSSVNVFLALVAGFFFTFIARFLPRDLMRAPIMLWSHCGGGFPETARLKAAWVPWIRGSPRLREAAQGKGPHGSRLRAASRRAGPCPVGRHVDRPLLPQLQGRVRREPL